MLMQRSHLHTVSATILIAALAGTGIFSGHAAAWDGDKHSAVRLIAGDSEDTANGPLLRAGVEIKLAPGWKTYWRYPGDAGVPPQFDFAKSDNVKAVTVAWPAPKRLVDSEGTTIGYKTDVVFPLRVVPADPARPVTLRLHLDYAICERLCIPVQGRAELVLKPGKGADHAAIAAAEKLVPKKLLLGAAGPFAVKAIKHDTAANPPRVSVDVAAPAGREIDVFAEGPDAGWALPVPDRAEGAPSGYQRFVFALDGLPPGKSAKGADLRITAVAGGDAIETTFRLD